MVDHADWVDFVAVAAARHECVPDEIGTAALNKLAKR